MPFSIYSFLVSSDVMFFGAIIICVLIGNFYVWPLIQENRKMKEQPSAPPPPQSPHVQVVAQNDCITLEDLVDALATMKAEVITHIELLVRNSNLENKNFINEYMMDIQDFFAKLIAYEEDLGKMLQHIQEVKNSLASSNEDLEHGLDKLLTIHREMVSVLLPVARELKSRGLLNDIDIAALEKIKAMLSTADEDLEALLEQMIKRQLSDHFKGSSAKFDRLFKHDE